MDLINVLLFAGTQVIIQPTVPPDFLVTELFSRGAPWQNASAALTAGANSIAVPIATMIAARWGS